MLMARETYRIFTNLLCSVLYTRKLPRYPKSQMNPVEPDRETESSLRGNRLATRVCTDDKLAQERRTQQEVRRQS